jgi:hypothetical protein
MALFAVGLTAIACLGAAIGLVARRGPSPTLGS